jgi:hypothetical protein
MYETHTNIQTLTSNRHVSTYLHTIIMPSLFHAHLQSKFPLEDQIDLVTGGSQEEVFLHLETLPCGLRGRNDFVFT